MSSLQALLDQIDQLDQQATKAPWESLGPSIESADYTQDDVVSTDVDCSTYCYGGIGRGIQNAKDAEFIALARVALPQLAEALRAVLDVLDDYTMPGKLHDPTGIAGAELETLEQYIREAITHTATSASGTSSASNTRSRNRPPTHWRPTMNDLPGNVTLGCRNCHSTFHRDCTPDEEAACDICGEFFPQGELFEFTEYEDMTERTNLGCDLCMNYQEADDE